MKSAQNVMGSPKNALRFFHLILHLTSGEWGGGGALNFCMSVSPKVFALSKSNFDTM